MRSFFDKQRAQTRIIKNDPMQNLSRDLEAILNEFTDEDEKRKACRAILDAVGKALKLEMKVSFEPPYGRGPECVEPFRGGRN